MTPNYMTFDLSDKSEAFALANLIRSFNEAGVPYGLKNRGTEAILEIGDGY